MEEKEETCPLCGYRGTDFDAAVKQHIAGTFNMIDVGFECPKCKHEFGFETT